jgi:hypothetical protein
VEPLIYPDPILYYLKRCLLDEIQLLRNQLSPVQQVFYYTTQKKLQRTNTLAYFAGYEEKGCFKILYLDDVMLAERDPTSLGPTADLTVATCPFYRNKLTRFGF